MKNNIYKYDAIIFDFDGVLVESVNVKTQAFAFMYAEYGPEIVKKVVDYHLQHGGISRFEKFRYYEQVLLGKNIGKNREKELGDRFSKLVIDSVVAAPWVPGAKEFLNRYSKEISLFVASGTPDNEIKEIVAGRRMSHYFASIHGTPTKKAEIISAICTKHDFNRKRVLMIGDAIADYDGAVKAGVSFIGRAQHSERHVFTESVEVIVDLCNLYNRLY